MSNVLDAARRLVAEADSGRMIFQGVSFDGGETFYPVISTARALLAAEKVVEAAERIIETYDWGYEDDHIARGAYDRIGLDLRDLVVAYRDAVK
jgi:hypothetical protein